MAAQMPDWDYTTDAVVVGSGGGGLCGALVARDRGLDVLVLEKAAHIGGSTGMSGGLVWIPNNPLMRAAGVSDSEEDALAYLDAVAGDAGPASSPERRRALVTEGPRLVAFLQGLGLPFRRADGYPDYHSDLPGGSQQGRNIETLIFDTHELGSWQEKIYAGMFAGIGLVGYGTELSDMLYYSRSLRAFLIAARVQGRSWAARLQGKALVANGGALAGRLLMQALGMGAEIWTESPLQGLVVEDGAIAGVVVRKDGHDLRVAARYGVLLAAGGFSRNDDMRARYGGDKATSSTQSMANAGDTGEVLTMAMALGAATDLMDEAIWVPVMRFPDGSAARYPARQMGAFSRSRWRAGSIIVDASGQRFANESMSYRELGQLMFARDREVKAIPSWLLFDDRFRRQCTYGARPGRMPEQWITDGFVVRAVNLDELAARCGIHADGLKSTIDKFNEYAGTGIDLDFRRGDSAYDRYMGDPRHRPNPCLAPLRQPPFYAVAVYPGDVGTFGGLVTDDRARVTREDGQPIPGLYATGNITAAVCGRGYLAAGGSIGPACTFGFVGMNDIADRAGQVPGL
jgi:3-oxosteroid 1-dehydrogenase